MKRLYRSRVGDGAGLMPFSSPVMQNGPLHEEQFVYINEAAIEQSSVESPPPPSAIKIKRKPLANVLNNGTCQSDSPDRNSKADKWTKVINEAYDNNGLDSPLRSSSKSNNGTYQSDSPDRNSKADKWTKVINEAYDNNGLDSPLRSSSKSRRSDQSGELLGDRVVDSFELRSGDRKSFGRVKNVVDSFNLYPFNLGDGQQDQDEFKQSSCATSPGLENSVTTGASSRESHQTPVYFEFDANTSKHIRKSKLNRESQAGLFSAVKHKTENNFGPSDHHFSSSSSENTSENSGESGESGESESKSKSAEEGRIVEASSSQPNVPIRDCIGIEFDPWEKSSVEDDQFSEQADKIEYRTTPGMNRRISPAMPGSGTTNGSASASSTSTSTSVWVKRLPPYTPSPTSFRPTKLEAITSIDSSSTTCTDVTGEVEECTADVLYQDMASDSVMKRARVMNKLPPLYILNGKRSPPLLHRSNNLLNGKKSSPLQHRSNKYKSNRVRGDTNCPADNSNATSTNSTEEIEECVADVLEQTLASDSSMMDERPWAPPQSSNANGHFNRTNKISEKKYHSPHNNESSTATSNSSREIEECVADISQQNSRRSITTSGEIEECVADISDPSPHRRACAANTTEKSSHFQNMPFDEGRNTGAWTSFSAGNGRKRLNGVKPERSDSRSNDEELPSGVESCYSGTSSRLHSSNGRLEGTLQHSAKGGVSEMLSGDQSSSSHSSNTVSLASVKNARSIRKEQEERISNVLKNDSIQLDSSPETCFTRSSTASEFDPASTSDSAEFLQEMLANFDVMLDDVESETSGSNPYTSINEDSGEKDRSYSMDAIQSSLALEGKERINFLSARASQCVGTGNFEEALGILRDILKIQKSKFGEMHSEVASAHHNIGIVHAKCAQNNTNASDSRESNAFAMKEFRVAAHVARQTKGEYHPSVAVSLARIGLIQIQVENHIDAFVTFKECLSIRQMAFGKKHSLVGKIHNNLGVVYLSLGKFREGLDAFESACMILRRTIRKLDRGDLETIGDIELDLADTLCNIGSAGLDWAEKKELSGERKLKLAKYAVVAFDEAIEIRCRLLGNNNILIAEARQLKIEGESYMETRSTRPSSPDISVLQTILPGACGGSQRASSPIYQSPSGDEESCLISQGKNGGCISSPWGVASVPFDEISGYSMHAKDSVQMQRVEPLAWGDPTSYNESRSKNTTSTSLNVSPGEAISHWVSFQCSQVKAEEESFVKISQSLSSCKVGKTMCSGWDISEGGELVQTIDQSCHRSSSTSAFAPSNGSNQSYSQHQQGKSLSISEPPSFDERRCGKESPFSPFAAPSFPVQNVNMDPSKNARGENEGKDFQYQSKNDSQTYSPRGILRNARSYQSQSKRSQLNVKGEDSLYDASVSNSGVGSKGGDQGLSTIEKSTNTMEMSGDGLVMSIGRKELHRKNPRVDEETMLRNPGKYAVEIHELAAQYLKVSRVWNTIALVYVNATLLSCN